MCYIQNYLCIYTYLHTYMHFRTWGFSVISTSTIIKYHNINKLLYYNFTDYFMNSRNNDLTIRECAKLYNSQQNECHRGRYNRDSYQFVCECMGHGCNRSLQQSVPAPAAFMSCFLLLIAVFYYQSDSI